MARQDLATKRGPKPKKKRRRRKKSEAHGFKRKNKRKTKELRTIWEKFILPIWYKNFSNSQLIDIDVLTNIFFNSDTRYVGFYTVIDGFTMPGKAYDPEEFSGLRQPPYRPLIKEGERLLIRADKMMPDKIEVFRKGKTFVLSNYEFKVINDKLEFYK